jgi:hypothetical protein
MSVFVDTGVLYSMHDTHSSRHETAVSAVRSAATDISDRLYISDYIYDEAVTLTLSRTGRFDIARTLGNRLLGESVESPFELLFIDRGDFERARETFDRYSDQTLSFTDATTVTLVESRNIDTVLSFDDDFDGIVDRTPPAEIA